MLASSSMTRTRLGGMSHLRLRSRQHDGNRRAFAGTAVQRNRAAVLFDDLFSVRHTETEALLLCCVERLEDLFCLFFIDAVTGVGDFESQPLGGVLDRDTQRAAGFHGLDCI